MKADCPKNGDLLKTVDQNAGFRFKLNFERSEVYKFGAMVPANVRPSEFSDGLRDIWNSVAEEEQNCRTCDGSGVKRPRRASPLFGVAEDGKRQPSRLYPRMRFLNTNVC
jgi:hypothetical protein